MKPSVLACVLALVIAAPLRAEPVSPRERIRLDDGWAFHIGNEWGLGVNLAKAGTGFGPAGVNFGDASWRRVNLPHDWAVELPFDPHADASHGFKAIGPGFPENSIAWYRRTFDLSSSDAGRRIWLEFGGVFRDCTVFVNGWAIGRHASGYNSFRYDVTDVVNCGATNVVAVRVDASVPEGWFYEGAGIYRHVWLVKTAPVAIAPDGVFVSSRFAGSIPKGPAQLHLETDLLNHELASVPVEVEWEVRGPSGQKVAAAQAQAEVASSETDTVRAETTVPDPMLWSPEQPALYHLLTTVKRGGVTVDQETTEFGIRTVGFDAQRGFLLNGRPYNLQGTCNHQDHAGVGSAIPDAVQYFRVAKLKEMGSNADRTSHNPPTEEFLDACDQLGMLVMDENRLLGSDADTLQRWREQIRRDRNHPSVAIWSIANEEFTVQSTPAAGRVAESLQRLAWRLDPTRPVTYAAPVGNEFTGINAVIQVRGWNYHVGPDMDAYHAQHPDQPEVGTEQGSTVGTRGIYANDPVRGYMTSYDVNSLSWSTSAEQWLTYFRDRPWLSGGFVWTGFDYRGEPTPYAWPCINSHFGIMDTCGFPKDNYWYYQACWTKPPVLHLLPHWNWPGQEGKPIDVRAFSNCDEVELWLNGRSLGRKTLSAPGQLQWSVAYEPGTLEAKGYRGGKEVAHTRVETTGQATALRLTSNRVAVTADGRDVAVIAVSAIDNRGRVVPEADVKVDFALAGAGRLIGVGNGDPSCHEPDQYIEEPRVQSLPVGDWRWRDVPNAYADGMPETKLDFDDRTWTPLNAPGGASPEGLHEQLVARGHFELSPEQLKTTGIELRFPGITADSRIFVNGQPLGPGGSTDKSITFDVGSLLRPGQNVVAIALSSYGAKAEVKPGVEVRLVSPGTAPAWSRSTFNGLAEAMVQAARTPGVVTLTASSPGLAPAKLVLTTLP
ncbi:MAG TPA: beta-galactosidase GalA [Opitutaceae bacterium]|jgi:beta-galactosidase